MNVHFKQKLRDIRFMDVNIGDTFEQDDIIYMKLHEVKSNDGVEDEYNAVRLSDGCLLWFLESELITLVDCELTAKERI